MQRRVAAEQDPANSRHQPMKIKMTASNVATDPARGTGEKDISYEIPVLRSEAFARALSEAKLQVVGSGGLRSLFERVTKLAGPLPQYQFKENLPHLQTMLRLVGAYEHGQYKQVSNDDLMWIVAALNYLVDPFDLIPDTTPSFGFVDDAIVIGFVADKTRQALDDFIIWERGGFALGTQDDSKG